MNTHSFLLMNRPTFLYVLGMAMALRSLERARKGIYRASLESSSLFRLTADEVADRYFISELFPQYVASLSKTLYMADATVAKLEERQYDSKRLAEFRQRLEPFRHFIESYPTGSSYLESRLNAYDKTSEEEFHLQRGRQQRALDDLLADKIKPKEVRNTIAFITGREMR